jgi:cob(I)alamin adenosyltransferase
MKKSKIYTRTGDQGETGLVSGNRTLKSDLRIDLYGELDELNSRLGFACSLMVGQLEFQQTINFFHDVQSAIFDLGSNLACEVENRNKFKLPQISNDFILELEHQIDKLDAELPELKNFILPGGSSVSSAIHLCRTNARSVERKLVHYFDITQEELPINSLIFLNRLSDYLFVLARYANKLNKIEEITWKPRK